MNEKHPRLVDTRMATLERTAADVIEVRIKDDVKLDATGIGEIVRAKHDLCATAEADILVVLPPEFDFELSSLAMNHSEAHGGCGLSRRLALAAQSPFNERLAGIYFKYNPRAKETAVFLEESDARTWLSQALPQPSLS